MEIIREVINILSNEKKRLLNLFLVLTFFFVGIYILQDRVYISDIKLAHNSQDGSTNTSALGEIVSEFSSGGANAIASSTNQFDMIPEVISSRDFLNKILEKKFNYNGKNQKLYLIYAEEDESEDNNIPLLKLDGRKELVTNIAIRKNLNNPVIGISVSSNNQQLSFDIANSILKQLQTELTNFQIERVNKRIDIIETQIKSSLKDLNVLEEDLRKFRVNNSNIMGSPTLRMEESKKMRDILVLSNSYSSLKIELELAKVKILEEANVLQVIDAPNVPVKKSAPRLRYMLLKLIFTFSFITLFYVYTKILLATDMGKTIRNSLSNQEHSQ